MDNVPQQANFRDLMTAHSGPGLFTLSRMYFLFSTHMAKQTRMAPDTNKRGKPTVRCLEARRGFWPQTHKEHVFSAAHCIGGWISVLVRRKEKLLKNWDYKAAEVPKRDFQKREDPVQVCGTHGMPFQVTPKVRSSPETLLSSSSQGSGMGAAQCHHITPRASGKVERDKKSFCHLKPPISPLAPGDEGWEMPGRSSR